MHQTQWSPERPLQKGNAKECSNYCTVVLISPPCGSAGKEFASNAGDLGSIPELGGSPGEGRGYPLQYSDLENSVDCIVHGVTKSQTRLSDFHFLSLIYMPCILKLNIYK